MKRQHFLPFPAAAAIISAMSANTDTIEAGVRLACYELNALENTDNYGDV